MLKIQKMKFYITPLYRLFFIACFYTLLAEGKQLNVEVSAKSAILINAETGMILYEKNAHQPCYPASITKVATALYALEKKNHALDELVMASQDSLSVVPAYIKKSKGSTHPSYRLEPDGTNIGIQIGEQLSFKVLPMD